MTAVRTVSSTEGRYPRSDGPSACTGTGVAAGGGAGAAGCPAVVTSWTASWSFPSTPPVPACRTSAIFCLRLPV